MESETYAPCQVTKLYANRAGISVPGFVNSQRVSTTVDNDILPQDVLDSAIAIVRFQVACIGTIHVEIPVVQIGDSRIETQ
jgi:hypothetical protein